MGWLIALGILVLLAILPLGASVKYNAEGLALKILAGPIRLQILPGKKKDPQKKKDSPQKPEQKKVTQKSEEPPKEAGGSITDFLPLVQIVLQLLDGLRRKLRINRLELKMILAAEDPCDLAVNYGRAWAALGNLWPQLERCFVIKKRNVEVACDFTAAETLVIARADITITLGRLLGLLVYHGVRAAKSYFNIMKSRKGGAVK